MSYSVTSWFVDQANSKVSEPLRKFVMKLPEKELVTDPSFDVGSFGGSSVWSYNVSSGIAVVSGTGYMWDGWADLITPGKTYVGVIEVVSYTGGHIFIPYDGNAANVFSASAIGVYSHTFTAVQTGSPSMYADLFVGAVDNMSIKEYEYDLSDRVLSWPSFGVEWDNIKPVRLTMNLANDDKDLNFLRTNKVNMQNSCSLDIGFTHATSGDETINTFKGKVETIQFNNGTIRMTMADKFKQLSERAITEADSSISGDYTGSEYLLSDIAWWLCTSHGGLDATTSTANVDIDWDSFATWAGVMSGDSVLVSGKFSGIKVLEALRKISRISKTAIYQEEDKINFHRFNLTHSYNTPLTNDEIIDSTLLIDSKRMINRKQVLLGYDVNSRYHQWTITEENSSSVNSYGVREDAEKDANLWYVNSQSAINFAQREVLVEKVPFDQMQVNVPLVGMLRTVGETISVTEPQMDLTGDSFRVMKRMLNMANGTVSFNADGSQLFGSITLSESSAVYSAESPYVSSLDDTNKVLV